MTRSKQIISSILLSIGIAFTVMALGVFAIPFIAAVAGTYEGGEQSWGAFLFYLVLAMPACGATLAAIFLRGWREARAGYVTLGVLFGLPLLTVVAALVHSLYDSLTKSPNHALQAVPGVTACAPARSPAPAAFPHRLRRPSQSLSLGSLGDSGTSPVE